jgi:hypothetical protein
MMKVLGLTSGTWATCIRNLGELYRTIFSGTCLCQEKAMPKKVVCSIVTAVGWSLINCSASFSATTWLLPRSHHTNTTSVTTEKNNETLAPVGVFEKNNEICVPNEIENANSQADFDDDLDIEEHRRYRNFLAEWESGWWINPSLVKRFNRENITPTTIGRRTQGLKHMLANESKSWVVQAPLQIEIPPTKAP